jgi:hypothetical protein
MNAILIKEFLVLVSRLGLEFLAEIAEGNIWNLSQEFVCLIDHF